MAVNLAKVLLQSYPEVDLLPLGTMNPAAGMKELLEEVESWHGPVDSLFLFLVRELSEDGVDLDEAIHRVEVARDDLGEVLRGLKAAQAEEDTRDLQGCYMLWDDVAERMVNATVYGTLMDAVAAKTRAEQGGLTLVTVVEVTVPEGRKEKDGG